MSIATEITRITGLRNRIRLKLISLGLMSAQPRSGDNDLEDCADVIDGIGGTQAITSKFVLYNVAGKQHAQIQDAQLIAQNIAEGVTILGVTGTHSGNTPTVTHETGEFKFGTPTDPDNQLIIPQNADYLDGVLLTKATNAEGLTLKPENIKNGIQIMGVQGTYTGTPSLVTANYTYNDNPSNSIRFAFGGAHGLGGDVLYASAFRLTPSLPLTGNTKAFIVNVEVIKASLVPSGLASLCENGYLIVWNLVYEFSDIVMPSTSMKYVILGSVFSCANSLNGSADLRIGTGNAYLLNNWNSYNPTAQPTPLIQFDSDYSMIVIQNLD